MPLPPNKVLFLSASDRINYGDLLFPIVFSKVFNDNELDIEYFGTVKSDLKKFGAIPTLSLKSLSRSAQSSSIKVSVVVGGGQVFFASYTTIYSFISKSYRYLLNNKFFLKINKRFKIAEWILSSAIAPLPFVIIPSSKIDVIYNAVCGGDLDKVNAKTGRKIIAALNAATHLSVRDNWSLSLLNKDDIFPELVPDSALIMSDFFSMNFLKKFGPLAEIQNHSSYIFLQLGIAKGPKDFSSFVESLIQYKNQLNCEKVICCPIGLAPGHEDSVILKKISELSSEIEMFIPKNIYDIMSCIAHSRAFFGTSLHGLITAYSFGVPFVPLNKSIPKLDSFVKTWTIDVCEQSFDFNDVDKIKQHLKNWNGQNANKNLVEQKKLVYNNFDRILTIINS